LDAAINTILAAGLKSASNIILKGCSAGGLATYIHADYVATLVPASAAYVAMPGAGFFLVSQDESSFDGMCISIFSIILLFPAGHSRH
jgi:hypothetical protein